MKKLLFLILLISLWFTDSKAASISLSGATGDAATGAVYVLPPPNTNFTITWVGTPSVMIGNQSNFPIYITTSAPGLTILGTVTSNAGTGTFLIGNQSNSAIYVQGTINVGNSLTAVVTSTGLPVTVGNVVTAVVTSTGLPVTVSNTVTSVMTSTGIPIYGLSGSSALSVVMVMNGQTNVFSSTNAGYVQGTVTANQGTASTTPWAITSWSNGTYAGTPTNPIYVTTPSTGISTLVLGTAITNKVSGSTINENQFTCTTASSNFITYTGSTRLKVKINNISATPVYICAGVTASTTTCGLQLAQNQWDVEDQYPGAYSCITASGTALIGYREIKTP